MQKGSLVDAEKTRFDFAHNAPMSADEIRRVEEIVNREILANVATGARVMAFDDAVKAGAMALFGEVRRPRARHRLLARAVRRHARRTHRRHQPVQDRRRRRRRRVRRIEAVTGENALGGELDQRWPRRRH